MSAHVVDIEVIQTIVNYADIKERGAFSILGKRYLPETIGQILLDENFRSVNFRYSEENKAPKYVHEKTYTGVYFYTNGYNSLEDLKLHEIKICSILDPKLILQLISNLDYHSCETNDWKETEAYMILERIKEMCANELTADYPCWFSLETSMELQKKYKELSFKKDKRI